MLGHCSASDAAFLAAYRADGLRAIQRFSGEYVAIIGSGEETVIVSSPYGVFQYFYTVQYGRLFHGDTVLEVIKQSELAWAWNYRALADVTGLSHCLGSDTLHAEVHRLPAASALKLSSGRPVLTTLTWYELHPPIDSSPAAAISAYNDAVTRSIAGASDVYLSMSGGFDSRVILSSLLASGIRPSLLTCGSEDATDVVISRQIAAHFDLPIEVISLSPADYLEHGERISRLTNGTKSADHWHTFLYPHKAALPPAAALLVGTNGEFAATYFLDRGILSRTLDLVDRALPAPALRDRFWSKKFKQILQPGEIAALVPELAEQFSPSGWKERLKRLEAASPGTLLDGLDRFYLQERVPHFMGNGLKLYADSASPRTPFLDLGWTTTIWHMNRHTKMGRNWHRAAIRHNCPSLLGFPEEGRAPVMAVEAPPLYWLRGRRRYPVVSYAGYEQWWRRDDISGFIEDNASVLEPLIDRRTLMEVVRQQRATGNRTAAVSFFLCMAFWCRQIREGTTPASGPRQ